MHDATKKGFKKRPPGPPVFVWNLAPGQRIPEPNIRTAKTVRLRIRDESVIVRPFELQPSGSFVGVIDGFEPMAKTEFEGMKIGDRITFEDAHIIGAND